MRRFALFGLWLGLLGTLAACPGTDRDFTQPAVDADTPVPDAAVDVVVGPPQPFRVVTWNVKNLYNDVRDSPEVKVADEIILPTQEYQAKLDAIASVLSGLSPDAVMFQEVENKIVLGDLAAKLKGAYAHQHITQGNDPRGIDIALLSNVPLDKVVDHSKEFFKASTDPNKTYVFARDVLEAHLTVNGRQVVLMGIHYKSGNDPDSIQKRLAEAEKTRSIVAQVKFESPGAAVIVLGDFNAPPGSPSVTALQGAAPLALVSATESIPAAERYSVTFGGNKQLYDDQIIDPIAFSLLDPSFPSSVLIPHTVEVDAASDHDPVAATYMVR